MAKMFYSATEAAEKLGQSEDDIKQLVRSGKLREFRDADTVNYKVEDVNALAPAVEATPEPAMVELSEGSSAGSSAGGSASDILLEPIEDSGIDLSTLGGSDVISLEESAEIVTSGGTSTGSTASGGSKEDTVVPSVGVNVFDDEELDEHVDPLAQTAVTDLAGLGIDAVSSGSGILDLTRESDDTSLGQGLLDEIYTDDAGEAGDVADMGDDTRAGLGLEDVIQEEQGEAGEGPELEPDTAAATPRVVAPTMAEHAPDAVAASLTALLVVAVAVMCFAGLGAAALTRGILPSLLDTIYTNLWMYSAGAVVVAVIASVLTYFVRKRGS